MNEADCKTLGNEGNCDKLFKDIQVQSKINNCFGQTKSTCWIIRSIG